MLLDRLPSAVVASLVVCLLSTQVAAQEAPIAVPAQTVAAPAPLPPNNDHGTHVAAYVLGAIGLASLGAGTAFGLLALEQKGIRDDHCSETQRLCDSTGVEANDLGRRYLRFSMLGFGLGTVSMLGSIWLFQESSTGPTLHADLAPDALQLRVLNHW